PCRTPPDHPAYLGVPYGHVIGNEKWRGSQIARGLQGKHVNRAQKCISRSTCRVTLFKVVLILIPANQTICFVLCRILK
uniref:Uncharacterized protein n=1 Tax=Chelonoidis abingdonii TaxID=106734 RepID=A0A8C0H8F5_CHEAB